MMTMTEMRDRAQERAAGMRTWALADGRTYIVRSRSQSGFYTVQTTNGHIDDCECEGWHFRLLEKSGDVVVEGTGKRGEGYRYHPAFNRRIIRSQAGSQLSRRHRDVHKRNPGTLPTPPVGRAAPVGVDGP